MGFDNGMPSTEQIKSETLREFRQESCLAGVDIEVSVRDASVTLAGTVASNAVRLAALQAARRAEGVFDVIDQLKVDNGQQPTNEQIAKAVRSAFAGDAFIPDRSIEIAVSNGWVALSGTVERLSQLEEAERITTRLNGVRGVYNLLEVNPQASPIENARDAIQKALRHYAAQEAEAININLKNGTADVSGKVHTWTEKQLVLGALSHAPGVKHIEDHLSVVPF